LVRELGGEGRGGILTEGGEKDILIKIVFGSQGEGSDFKIIFTDLPLNLIK